MANKFLGKIKSQTEVGDHEFILMVTFSVMPASKAQILR